MPAHVRPAGIEQKAELADVVRLHGAAFLKSRPSPYEHVKILHAVEDCRTAALGGHRSQCTACGHEHHAYHSCRNRHCPKCQTMVKIRWVEARQAEVLPVGYFHVVFTLPHELNPLILVNKKAMISMLFNAASETLLEFGERHLGGKIGVTTVLHTWSQTLGDHFHLHCVVPAGALLPDGTWKHARPRFLFPVRALSKVFRGKYIGLLRDAFQNTKLQYHVRAEPYATESGQRRLLRALYSKKWVVYAKEPFANPSRLLEYLARYTHRVAISNDRIIEVDEQRVVFAYRDRKHGNQKSTMTLAPAEFLRRFLLHSLPKGLMRLRHFGILANRAKKEDLLKCRAALNVRQVDVAQASEPTSAELIKRLTGVDVEACPQCKTGRMVVVAILPSVRWAYHRQVIGIDSS